MYIDDILVIGIIDTVQLENMELVLKRLEERQGYILKRKSANLNYSMWNTYDTKSLLLACSLLMSKSEQ